MRAVMKTRLQIMWTFILSQSCHYQRYLKMLSNTILVLFKKWKLQLRVQDHIWSLDNCVSGGDKVWGGGWGNPFQGAGQAVPMGPEPGPVEGAWYRGHQDLVSPNQTFLPNPDETRTGAEGLCQPHHCTRDGAQTHEHLSQCTDLDCHRLLRYTWSN